MGTPRQCKFYQDPENIHIDGGIGYCDLDSDQATCEGCIDICEKSIALKTYLFEQIKREGGLEWERKRNIPFSTNLKS
jgi:hypothetical protein